MFPLSKFSYTTPLLILLSIALVVAQMILDDANVYALWTNWTFAGIISVGIWYVTKLYKLCGVNEGKSITISWPLLCACLNFSLCHFPYTEHFWWGILLIIAMLSALAILLSLWQGTSTVGWHLVIGMLIGFISTLLPHTLLWLLLLPLVDYHMRSWSWRNASGTLTGAVLSIWIVYCTLFLWEEYMGPTASGLFSADQVLRNYALLIDPENFNLMSVGFDLWQLLFLSLMALLVIIYSISALLLNVGNSIRTDASISLISTLSISMVVLLFFDITHLSLYISLLALFLSIQLTIHQANVRTSFNEWWTLFIILAMMSLTALPLWL